MVKYTLPNFDFSFNICVFKSNIRACDYILLLIISTTAINTKKECVHIDHRIMYTGPTVWKSHVHDHSHHELFNNSHVALDFFFFLVNTCCIRLITIC